LLKILNKICTAGTALYAPKLDIIFPISNTEVKLHLFKAPYHESIKQAKRYEPTIFQTHTYLKTVTLLFIVYWRHVLEVEWEQH